MAWTSQSPGMCVLSLSFKNQHTGDMRQPALLLCTLSDSIYLRNLCVSAGGGSPKINCWRRWFCLLLSPEVSHAQHWDAHRGMQTLLSSQEASWTFQTDSQAGAGVPKCLLLSPERQIWGLLKEKEKKSCLFKSSIRCDFNIRLLKSANY